MATENQQPTLADVKKAIDDSNRLFEEFKQTNDTRIKQLETRGVVDPLITEKLQKLNAAIDNQSAINEAFMATQATVNRLTMQGLASSAGDDANAHAREVRSFNLALKSNAARLGRPAPNDATAEDYDTYKSAFDNYCRHGRDFLSEAEKKTLMVGSDPDGGYLVTPDTTGRMVTRIFETSPMRQYASSQTIGTDRLEGSADLDEATFGWVAENGSRPVTNTPQVPAPWQIPVHEAYASPDTTQKVLEDANIDVQAWLAKKVGDKLGRGFNSAFVVGNGVGKPRGFTTYNTAATPDATRAWGTFEHVATGTAGGFGADPNGVNKLITLIHALKDVYTANAAWYLNRFTLGQLRQLTDNSVNGKYVFIPSFAAGQPDSVLGYPVRKMQDMVDYTTSGGLAVAYGDMMETYQIVDRLGITVLVDPYTAKPKVIFYSRARVGGDVVNFESLKFLKFS